MCKRYSGKEAAEIGLANESVPSDRLRERVEEVVAELRGYSSQTIRATKVSLNYDSDALYPSWQHGMELLANIWGTEESLEGMNAFLEKRPADFHQFRERNKEALDTYLDDFTMDRNQHDNSRARRES